MAKKISCAEVARKVVEVLRKIDGGWTYSLDVSGEEDGWTADYAYFSYDLEFLEEYVDVTAVEAYLLTTINDALGPSFKIRAPGSKVKDKPGALVAIDHGGEFELIRVKDPKKPRKLKPKKPQKLKPIAEQESK